MASKYPDSPLIGWFKFSGPVIFSIKGGNMKRILISTLIAGSLLTACVAVPGGHGPGGVVIAPLLPPVVVLGVEPYYYYGDFHYHYTNGSWYYSRSRRGPWVALPRDRYPREVRFERHDRRQERNQDYYRRDRNPGHDRRDRDRYDDNSRY